MAIRYISTDGEGTSGIGPQITFDIFRVYFLRGEQVYCYSSVSAPGCPARGDVLFPAGRGADTKGVFSMAEMIWNGVVTVYNFIMDNIVIINILFALIIVFFQRRSPQTVWTWLLLLYFIPILGFILYLVIGQDFHKSRMFKAKEIEGELKYAVR